MIFVVASCETIADKPLDNHDAHAARTPIVASAIPPSAQAKTPKTSAIVGDASSSISNTIASESASAYLAPVRIATLENKAIKESSGIAASIRNKGIYWTHNDSGNSPRVFAFDEQGVNRGTWSVGGATNVDWEDIAIASVSGGAAQLYIGDIGDNLARRKEIAVYRFDEPLVSGTANNNATTAPAVKIRLRYPDGARDAETLLVHPATGDIYIIAKTFAAKTSVYQATARSISENKAGVTTLTRVAELSLPAMFGNLVTGGDISRDGRSIALCDYLQGYELTLPADAKEFNRIWQQSIAIIQIGARQQGEAICYSPDGKSLLATSEKLPTPLYRTTK